MDYHPLGKRFERAAYLTKTAWSLYRHGRLEAALSRVREARECGPEPSVAASLDRLEQMARRQLDGHWFTLR
jgi:hypothetical protein